MPNNFFKSLPLLPVPPRRSRPLVIKATESLAKYGRPVKTYTLPDAPVGFQAFYKARRECEEQIRIYRVLRHAYLKAREPKRRELTANNLMILGKIYPSEKKLVNYNRDRSGSESSFYSDRATRGTRLRPVTPEGIRSLPVTSERIKVATSCVEGFDRTVNVSLTSKPAVVGRQARIKREDRSKAVTSERTPVASFQSIKESLNSTRAAAVRLPESNTKDRSMAATPERRSSPAKPERSQKPALRSRESKPDDRVMLYDKLERGDFGARSPEFPGAFKLMSNTNNNSLPKRVRWADNVVGGTCESELNGFEAIGRSAVLLTAALLACN